MSKIIRVIGLLVMVMALGACVDETPAGDPDLGDTNRPLYEDMGEVEECDMSDACWDEEEAW